MMDEKAMKQKIISDTVKGLKLTKKEMQTLRWIAEWERDTVLNVCSIIHKAKKYSLKEVK
jgi:hypothetical protein